MGITFPWTVAHHNRGRPYRIYLGSSARATIRLQPTTSHSFPEKMLNFDAAIFDMDGVITKTAAVHSLAWKKMFDEYLHHREKAYGEPFREFTHGKDYLAYVDGRPRYKGVEAFLK